MGCPRTMVHGRLLEGLGTKFTYSYRLSSDKHALSRLDLPKTLLRHLHSSPPGCQSFYSIYASSVETRSFDTPYTSVWLPISAFTCLQYHCSPIFAHLRLGSHGARWTSLLSVRNWSCMLLYRAAAISVWIFIYSCCHGRRSSVYTYL